MSQNRLKDSSFFGTLYPREWLSYSRWLYRIPLVCPISLGWVMVLPTQNIHFLYVHAKEICGQLCQLSILSTNSLNRKILFKEIKGRSHIKTNFLAFRKEEWVRTWSVNQLGLLKQSDFSTELTWGNSQVPAGTIN